MCATQTGARCATQTGLNVPLVAVPKVPENEVKA